MVDNDLDPDFDIEDKPGTASYKRRRGAAEGGANGPETVENEANMMPKPKKKRKKRAKQGNADEDQDS